MPTSKSVFASLPASWALCFPLSRHLTSHLPQRRKVPGWASPKPSMFGDLPKPALLRVLALKLIFLLPLFISIDLLGVWQLGSSNIFIPVKRVPVPYCPEIGLTIPWTNNIWSLHLISLCFSIFLPFSLMNLPAITLLNLRELFLFCPSVP